MADVATKPVVAVVEPDVLSSIAPVKEIPSAEEVAYGIVTVTVSPSALTDAILRPATLASSIEAAIAAATSAGADDAVEKVVAVVEEEWAVAIHAPPARAVPPSRGRKDAVRFGFWRVREAGARTVSVPVGRVPPFQAQRP